jgi:NAD(P)-dependent dehydrogenase (short-subunit alcohol dehydrogenase family)
LRVPDDATALAGQVAIVTGGASGIGRATARQLAVRGAAVAIFGRDEAAGAETVAELAANGARALFVRVDLAEPESIPPAVERVIDELGAVDILVNNAAVRGMHAPAGVTTVLEASVDDWDFVHAVNLRAPFLLIQAVGRHFVDRGRGGRIVNVTSSAAFQAARCSTHYASSKAALTSLTRTAAAELGPYDVNVNAVAPSLTRTSYRAERMPDGDAGFQRIVSKGPMANLLHRVTEPEDVAAVIVFLCLPASRQITGQTLHPSGGFIV